MDALSEKLQKEGKLLEALACMEKSLVLRGHIFGLESVEVHRACKSVGEMCNFLAMTYLQQDLFDVTLDLLKKAEVLTERHRAVRAVTFNNLACYYRKRGKLRTALNYCRQALGIEAKLTESVKSADTHLNMCTILSELKRHEKAIVHARIALKLLLLELFGEFNELVKQQEQGHGDASSHGATGSHEALATGNSQAASQTVETLRARLPPDRVAVLAIAYHNLAVQQEFLRQYSESLVSYEKAAKVVTTHLGHAHPLVASLTDSLNAAKKKMRETDRERERGARGAGGRQPQEAGRSGGTRTLVSLRGTPAKPTRASAGLSDGEYDGQARHSGFTSD